VAVAHSGGAAVAVELAVRRPDLVAAVAALDGTLGFPAELLEQTAPLLAALRGPAWCEVIAGFVAAGFLPLTTRTCSAAPSRTSSSCPQHMVAGVGERIAASGRRGGPGRLWRHRHPAALRPVRRDLELADLDRLAKLVPNLTLGRVVGLGHDQLLATPAQSVAMIERILAVTPVPA
jgi:pimeloyl-ACP methyl ester carboxylesterase